MVEIIVLLLGVVVHPHINADKPMSDIIVLLLGVVVYYSDIGPLFKWGLIYSSIVFIVLSFPTMAFEKDTTLFF